MSQAIFKKRLKQYIVGVFILKCFYRVSRFAVIFYGDKGRLAKIGGCFYSLEGKSIAPQLCGLVSEKR